MDSLALVAFIFGLIIGSFLNVVILRFDEWESIINTRSRCPECKEPLRWYDLIPLISFVTLRGKCRYCHKPISWQYPAVELATGLLFLQGYHLLFIQNAFELWRLILLSILFVVIIGCLVVIFCHDLYEMMIPDLISYILLVAAIAFGLLYQPLLLDTVYGGLIGVAPIALLVYPSKGKWMGEGDVKIAAALGFLVGYPAAIVFIALSFILGGAYGALAVAMKQAKLKTAVPFAPFLIAGGLIALFYGSQIVFWYMGRLTFGYF